MPRNVEKARSRSYAACRRAWQADTLHIAYQAAAALGLCEERSERECRDEAARIVDYVIGRAHDRLGEQSPRQWCEVAQATLRRCGAIVAPNGAKP